ncbi:MAG TPA: response regulator transcription factor [Pirellulaceae bacterium]|jgi:two-component system invasion response regulator UvrY|nr:response regulator transcription factor [Pirellulaceae bacterium]
MAEALERQPIRVLLVDDYEAIRMLLSRLLSRQAGMLVVGVASTGEEAIALTHERAPEVVIMDAVMPGIGGVEATRRLLQDFPKIRVIGHSANESDSVMLAAGAVGFVRKGSPTHQLLDAIRQTAK